MKEKDVRNCFLKVKAIRLRQFLKGSDGRLLTWVVLKWEYEKNLALGRRRVLSVASGGSRET